MPVTFAHPAAVLPLRGVLPLSALAAGSMIPDLPLFVPPLRQYYGFTHSPVGIVTADLAAGLLAWMLWRWLLARPVTDAAPPVLRRRLPPQNARAAQVSVFAAVPVGAATHLVWDAFTHEGRWGVQVFPWLTQLHAGLPGYKWAQYASGLLGLLVLALAVVSWMRGTPPGPERAPLHPRLAAAMWVAPVLAGGLVAGAYLFRPAPLEVLAFQAVTRGAAAAAVILVGVALLWHVADLRDLVVGEDGRVGPKNEG